MGSELAAAGIGLVVGVSIWFPYRHILNRLVAKKRETSAILQELSLDEKQHAETYNKTSWTDNVQMPWTHTTTGSNNSNIYPFPYTTAAPHQYGTVSTATGTSVASTNVSIYSGAHYCTECNCLVGEGLGSCPHGTGAP